MGATATACLFLLTLLSAASAHAAKGSKCSSGRTHAKLLQAELLPSACLPSADDYTGQAVFQCLQSWKISYSNCRVVLAPDLTYSSSGLPCRFFSSQGNITGDHTARVQAVVDRVGLLAFLLENPHIAERLNGGGAAAPTSSRELAENLALALHSFFHHTTHHKHPKHPNKQASPALPGTPAAANPTPDPNPTLPETPAAANPTPDPNPALPETPTATPNPNPSAAPAAPHHTRRLLLDPKPRGVPSGPAGRRLAERGGADVDDMSGDDEPAEVSRSGGHLYFASMDSCVYIYKVKRRSKFLSPDPAPGRKASQDNPALTVSCIVGITTMVAAAVWFAAARVQAIRQSQIADALILQQQVEQRAALEATISSRAASRATSSRSSGSVHSSSGSADGSRRGSSDLTRPLLEGEAKDVEEGAGAGAEAAAPGGAADAAQGPAP